VDATTLRLLYRLSMAVVVLVFSVAGLVVGLELPFSRASRGLPVLGLLGSVVAILLVSASLSRRRQPDSRLAALAPEALGRRAMRWARGLGASSRDRCSAALHRRRLAERLRQAELAAIEAAETNDRLAPERIRTAAQALFRLVYLAWDARDSKRLATLLSPELLVVWERALDAHDAAGQHHRAQVLGDVKISLVGLTADATRAATAIVRVEAQLDVRVSDLYGKRDSSSGSATDRRRLRQYWTLARGDGPWIVQAIEERTQGDRHLTEPIAARTAK